MTEFHVSIKRPGLAAMSPVKVPNSTGFDHQDAAQAFLQSLPDEGMQDGTILIVLEVDRPNTVNQDITVWVLPVVRPPQPSWEVGAESDMGAFVTAGSIV